jgi:hypothetical protein
MKVPFAMLASILGLVFAVSGAAAQDASFVFEKRLNDLEKRVDRLEKASVGWTFDKTKRVASMCPCGSACGCESLGGAVCGSEACPAGIRGPRSITARAPVGHTHTCPRCGTTWDHSTNPSHNCPRCGTPQYVQDPVARTVTVGGPAYSLAPQAFGAGGGCAGGSCGVSTSSSRRGFGIFRR